jgi:ornithine carbamoyltransferase
MSAVRHFTDLADFDSATLLKILKRASALKKPRKTRKDLAGKTLALIFEKPSTRTRVSFEVGMKELGGEVVCLTGKEMQLGHGETLSDTSKVLGRFVHAIMIRTFEHTHLKEFTAASTVPVINGLTNFSHPCQVMADLLTVLERFGSLKDRRVTWIGDGDNNVLTSWIQAAKIFDFPLVISCPRELQPHPSVLPHGKTARVMVTNHSDQGLKDAEVVITDTWVSMHNEDADCRRAVLAPYQVDERRMGLAAKSAIFLHCLPAHRNEEVTDAVIDGPQSAVWDEAENRLHAQKAILLWCFGKI